MNDAMQITDEMVEAGLTAYLKAMDVQWPVHEYPAKFQRMWRSQVRAILAAGLNAASVIKT